MVNMKRLIFVFNLVFIALTGFSQNIPKGNTTLSVSQSSIGVSYSSGETRFTVTSNVGYKVSSSYSWLHVYNYGDYIRVVYDENTSYSSRSGSISVVTSNNAKSLSVSVTQQGKPSSYLYLSQQSVNADASGGRFSISVSTDALPWNYSAPPYWCSIEAAQSGSFILSVSANTSSSARSGSVIITAGNTQKTISISQKANEEIFICNLSSIDFEASGGNRTLSVTTNGRTSSWTYESPSWIKMTWNNYSGSFQVSCSANNSTSSRSGYIKLIAKDKGKTKYISVTQKGGTASRSSALDSKMHGYDDFVVDKDYYYVDSRGGYYAINIMEKPGANIRLSKVWTDTNWLEEENIIYGGGQFHVKKNLSKNNRTGHLYIRDTRGRTITVTVVQKGK